MKILFRIPFTEYYLARDIKLCFLRKVWAADYLDVSEVVRILWMDKNIRRKSRNEMSEM